MKNFKPHFLPTLFTVLFILTLYKLTAQSGCERFENWTEVLKIEFPQKDFRTIVLGSPEHKRMLYNLYSDKYFVPAFGEPFDQMSEKDREKIYQKSIKCKKSNNQSSVWIADVFITPFYEHASREYSFSNISAKVREYRGLREKYDAILDKINSNSVSLNNLQEYQGFADSKFGSLLPSEVKKLKEVAQGAAQKIADKEVKNLVTLELMKPNSFATLESITNLQRYNDAFRLCSPEVRNKANAELNDRAKFILEGLLVEEASALERIGPDIMYFDDLNRFQSNFKDKYNSFYQDPKHRQITARLKDKRVELVRTNVAKIKNQINAATTMKELSLIEQKYLRYPEDIPEVKDLNSAISSRKNQLEQMTQQQKIDAKIVGSDAERKRIMNEITSTGEPTEEQMKYAVMYQIVARVEEAKGGSNRELDNNNPASIWDMIVGKSLEGTEIKMVSFKKYGCVSSNSKPGFVCDYASKIDASGSAATQWRSPSTTSTIKTGRFLKVEGNWMLVEEIN